MIIKHKDEGSKGSFFIEREGEVKAEITYSKAGDAKITIDHTEVSEELRKNNLGTSLVKHLVNYARNNQLKVIPICPFTKSVIEEDESLQDVLA